MNFWKALGGAAIGVGAIAAAPFTGGGSVLGAATLLSSLAGAGTIAAAVGAGVAGAAIGAAMEDDDDISKKAYQAGQKDAKAKQDLAIRSLEEKLTSALQKLQESSHHFNAILALEAVAIATANCDGNICDQERSDIEAFISGISSSSLPTEVKQRIESMYKNPLNINEAFIMARNSGLDMSVFDEVILLVIHADGVTHRQEEVFMQSWNQLKAA